MRRREKIEKEKKGEGKRDKDRKIRADWRGCGVSVVSSAC